MIDRTLVLVHTPKSAGKALREALKSEYGERLYLLYSNPMKFGFPLRAAQRLKGLVRIPPEVHRAECVFGHFSLARYRRAIKADYALAGMFFRHPLNLLVSYYFYHNKKIGRKVGPENEREDILDLARTNAMRRLYRIFLGGLRPSELSFIGLYEELPRSVTLLSRLVGRNLDVGARNVTGGKPQNTVSHLEYLGIKKTVERALAENIGLYNEAADSFWRNADTYGLALNDYNETRQEGDGLCCDKPNSPVCDE